jgi:hypothetical protein
VGSGRFVAKSSPTRKGVGDGMPVRTDINPKR